MSHRAEQQPNPEVFRQIGKRIYDNALTFFSERELEKDCVEKGFLTDFDDATFLFHIRKKEVFPLKQIFTGKPFPSSFLYPAICFQIYKAGGEKGSVKFDGKLIPDGVMAPNNIVYCFSDFRFIDHTGFGFYGSVIDHFHEYEPDFEGNYPRISFIPEESGNTLTPLGASDCELLESVLHQITIGESRLWNRPAEY